MGATTASASPGPDDAPAWTLCIPRNVPLPPKLYGMLHFAEHMGLSHVVSWLPHGRAFRIHDPGEFMARVVGRFLEAKKLRSVHRQMLCWGFRRNERGEGEDEWFHPSFVRGHPLLMKDMVRTKVKGKANATIPMPYFLRFLDGRYEVYGRHGVSSEQPARPGRVSPLSRELSSLSFWSFAASSRRGAATHRSLPRCAAAPAGASNSTSTGKEVTGPIHTRFGSFDHPDGTCRRIPSGWYFPKVSIQQMYIQWHCGDQAQKISPLKNLDERDISVLERRGKKAYECLRILMDAIDRVATAVGVRPEKVMTQAQAASCFLAGGSGVNLVATVPPGLTRSISRMTWESVAKLLPKKQRSFLS